MNNACGARVILAAESQRALRATTDTNIKEEGEEIAAGPMHGTHGGEGLQPVHCMQ